MVTDGWSGYGTGYLRSPATLRAGGSTIATIYGAALDGWHMHYAAEAESVEEVACVLLT